MQQKISAVSDWTYSSKVQSVRQSRSHGLAVQSVDVASCPSRTPCWLCGFQNPAAKWEPAHLCPSSTSSPLQVTQNHLKVRQGKDQLKGAKGQLFGCQTWQKQAVEFFLLFQVFSCVGCLFPLLPATWPQNSLKYQLHRHAYVLCTDIRGRASHFSHNSHGIQCFSQHFSNSCTLWESPLALQNFLLSPLGYGKTT